jgi:hypothetical protein
LPINIILPIYINRKSTAPENYKRVAQAAIVTALFSLPWLWFIFPIFAESLFSFPDQLISAKSMSAREVKHIQFFDIRFTSQEPCLPRCQVTAFQSPVRFFGKEG